MCGFSTRRPRTAIRPTPSLAMPIRRCFASAMAPRRPMALNGAQLANPFDPSAVLGENDRTTTRSTSTGFSLQATNTDQLFGHNNHFVVGTSFDYSVTHFNASAELGTIGPNYVVSGSGIFLGQSGDPASDGPVSLRTTNQYTGLYALDTFDVTNAFSITGGGRFNVANINLQDQLGTALNGNDTYTRFNPIIGGTYKITSGIDGLCRLFRSQSRADAARTRLRRSGQSLHHRHVPGVRSAAEAGGVPHRGSGLARHRRSQHRHAELEARRVPRRQHRRHPQHSQPDLQGFGYFQNVGSTRRQGIEAEVSLKSDKLQINASYTFVDARFLDALQLGSEQPVRRRQRQYPGDARQPDPGGPAQPAQGRHRLCRHRCLQGRRRRAVRRAASISSATNPTSS